MKLLSKISVPVLGALMLGAFSQANAIALPTTLTYDDLVVSPSPGNSTGPWLTATLSNITGGVHFSFAPSNITSPEFITSVFFSLSGAYSLGSISNLTPASNPTSGYFGTDNCNGSSPASTGPWQLCFKFAPSAKYDGPESVSFDFSGIQLSNFVSNSAGWFSVAHLQGINDTCSTWIGAYNGGSVPPVTGNDVGTCGGTPPTNVPEPGTLSLIGLALAGFGGMRALRKRKTA